MTTGKIAIVEDGALTARDLMYSLEEMGYTVCGPVMTGKDAISLARHERPDLMLMDIVLRGPMDGIQAATFIRRKVHVPAVFLTAYTDQDKLNRAKSAEPLGYLVKPFSERELHSTIEMALAKAERDRKLEESEENFRTVADFTYDWEMWLAPDGRYVYVSPSCERITGYKRREFKKDARLIEIIAHPDDREFVIEQQRRQMESHDVIHYDFRIHTKSGEERWIGHNSQAVFGRNGDWLGRRISNRDITDRKEMEREKEELIRELQGALADVKTLQGLVPICAHCKNIRDDKGYWQQIERYISDRSNARFSHGICPDCAKKLYPELYPGDCRDNTS